MLWYVCKIEHIVRNYTRCWLHDLTDKYSNGKDIASLCVEFSQQDDFFESMCAMFNHGVSHVSDSIAAHVSRGVGFLIFNDFVKFTS